MRFRPFVEALDKAEATASRLETAAALAQAFAPMEPDDLRFAVNFLLGQLGPAFAAPPVGIGDKYAVKAVAAAGGVSEETVTARMRESGDLGEVAAEALAKGAQQKFGAEPLEMGRVRTQLERIAGSTGKGANERRIAWLQELLAGADPAEAKYIVRFLVGKMRVGIGQGQILDALASMAGDRKRKAEVEAAYNRHPDLAEVAARLKAGGFEGLKGVAIEPFVPVRPMLAERLTALSEVLEKMGGRAALDYKYDGLRMQVHFKGGEVRIFSRNLEPYTDQFPDVVANVKKGARAGSFIVEGEGVIIDPASGAIRPFQEASRRRGRKYALEETAKQLPFAVFLFDAMYLDGQDLTGLPLVERRAAITEAVKEGEGLRCSTLQVVEDAEAAEEFFMDALAAGCEGVIAKSLGPDGTYRAGARGFAWIKYKRDYSAELGDTVDLVVVGAFAGRGRRAGHYGSLLMAARDAQSGNLVSLCKLASGFSDADLEEIDQRLKPLAVAHKPKGVESGLTPDTWLEPKFVMEVRGAELTLSPVHKVAWGKIKEGAGLALRFPRFERWRDDKGLNDLTAEAELVSMHKRQREGQKPKEPTPE